MSDPDRLAEIQEWWSRVKLDPRGPLYASRHRIDWLIGEVEGLRTELAAALGGWQREAGAMIERGREVDRLREMLGAWVKATRCFWCNAPPGAIHGSRCELAVALGLPKHEAAAPPPKG